MHKVLLPLAAALAFAPALGARASEFPGVDHFCYWINNSGQVLNLDAVCGVSPPVVLPPVALGPAAAEAAQEEDVAIRTDFLGSMRASGYNLMAGNLSTSGSSVNYDVWSKRDGTDYLYFIWGSNPGQGMDNRSEPEVVVRFFPPDKVARANDAVAQACYFSSCGTASLLNSAAVSAPQRWENYSGNCLFPWQSASDGSQCGARAAVIREGGA